MDQHEQDEEKKYGEEPPIEDFLPNEEDVILRKKQKKRKSLLVKLVSIGLVLALLISFNQVWPQVFNLPSIKFLQKSNQLSKQEDIKKYKEAVVTIQDPYTKGTGFNVSEDGFIITNRHVVEDMNPISVIFPQGDVLEASIVQMDSELDLAFLKVDGNNLPFLTLSKPEKWTTHDHIYVIGNPLFHNQIVNEGNILEESNRNHLLMISAPIYKGNSGSPVIGLHGEAIGVVYAKTLDDGTGLAIPVEAFFEKIPQNQGVSIGK
ncbi:S1C family serine protease [Bacillus tuaregi]|uniref:S1C family serine protease n=1 Tax=Bacillus tuaregi TaxID=1816695 RepID=UPI000ACCF794|nr:serine protease [Bacillus tuaregi]